ncbi:hypothetical protein EYB45_04740 [Erythrobacteraceae bacterium CFH 75059]|uniref:hypothetical protein n=1 Tax=Qipengyuania thermophila TaxID=2509361 RepID=UPI0010207062|nr:hypothetical protein [Qipengyuania thermophila]TCD04854.1 hypothetical protein EYB45_04740 [Erythrobacteraceae bacterium CFH 75059]
MTALRERLSRAVLLGTAAALLVPSPALANPRTEVRVSGALGVENNPFLTVEDSGEGVAATAEIQVEPSLYLEDERTTLRFYGNLRLRQFFQNYGTDASVLLGTSGSTRVDERTTLTGGATFQSSRSAIQDAFLLGGTGGLIGLEPGTVPTFDLIDPTVPGSRQRFTRYGAEAGVQRRLTPRDVASVGLAFNESRTSGDFGFDYRVADLVLGYGRALNERTTLQGNLALSRSDLLNSATGDAFSVTPLIGIQQQISERLNWSAQAGLAYSRVNAGPGLTIDSTTFAFSVSGCRRSANANLCIAAQQQPRPTTFGGFTNTTGVNVGYDVTLNRRDSLGFTGSYQRSEQLAPMAFGELPISAKDELLGFGAEFRRAFTNRLVGFANASYTRIWSELFPDRDANVRALVGVTYIFGRQR